MKTIQAERNITLNLREIRQLRQWYRSFATDRNANMTPNDLVLDAKLAYNQTDMEARVVIRAEAVRARAVPTRLRHTGVERRSREVQVVPQPRRTVRYVLSA